MADKIFLFTEKELAQLENPKTKAIAMSGDTWEEAFRFMLKQPWGNSIPEVDQDNKTIGFRVSWLDPEEQIDSIDMIPIEIVAAANSSPFDDEFVEESIKDVRKMIRGHRL